MKIRKILLIRHAESLKNLRDEHGGEGDSLSEEGIKQCNKISAFLCKEKLKQKNTTLFYSSNPQVVETVDIINKKNHYKHICDNKLNGIDLGVLAGLSRDEALKKFPSPAKRLEKWRQGKLKIDKLNIPKGEDAINFYRRIKSFIEDRIVVCITSNIIIIGTQSTLIMFLNFFILGKSFNFSKYKNYNFDCGSVTKIIFHKRKVSIEYFNNTSFFK
jgi:broad specificity phosphatase PhoE